MDNKRAYIVPSLLMLLATGVGVAQPATTNTNSNVPSSQALKIAADTTPHSFHAEGQIWIDDTATPTPTLLPGSATPSPSLTDTPTATAIILPTDTPTVTRTPTGTSAITINITSGVALGPFPHPDGANIWNPGLVYDQRAQLPKMTGMGIKRIRVMQAVSLSYGIGDIATPDWSNLDRALIAILNQGMEPALVLDRRSMPTDVMTDTWQARTEDMLVHVIEQFGAKGWRIEGGNEEENPSERAWAAMNADAVNHAESLTRQNMTRFMMLQDEGGPHLEYCTPPPITQGYNSLDRLLLYMTENNIRFDCVAVHYYGQVVDYPTWAARIKDTVYRHVDNKPIYVTEWAMAGHKDTRLRTEENAVWALNTIALSGGTTSGDFQAWDFSAGIGQGYGHKDGDGTPEGFLGAVALSSDHAVYPVGNTLRLVASMGMTRTATLGLPEGPLRAMTDESGDTLLWNTGPPITVTVPCTAPLTLGRIDAANGNSFTIWNDATLGGTANLDHWTILWANRLAALSSPWNSPAPWASYGQSKPWPALACSSGRAAVSVPTMGIVWAGPPS